MIYSVRGILIEAQPNLAVVECAGVGYACKTTGVTLSQLPPRGSEVTLYTYLNVTENAVDLFGFADLQELECFKMMTAVSGVGPKVALSILSDLTPNQFALCVVTGDVKQLTRSPGVGPKLAQRIVMELKDKLGSDTLTVGGDGAGIGAVNLGSDNVAEAIGALVALGYAQSQAAAAVAKLDTSLPSQELIKGALKRLAGGR